MFLAQDECSLLSIPTVTRLWAETGNQPRVMTLTSKRERRTILAATNLRSGQQTSLIFNTGDSITFIELLKQILKDYPNQNITLILDNVRFHHAKKVKAFLQESPNKRLKLFFLPPYSPDLNPQEWVFKWFRSEVTHNHCFHSFADLIQATSQFLISISIG